MGEVPAVEAVGLVKNYGTTKALSGLDLTVPAGTVSGYSGRTERARPPPSAFSPRSCARTGVGRGSRASTS